MKLGRFSFFEKKSSSIVNTTVPNDGRADTVLDIMEAIRASVQRNGVGNRQAYNFYDEMGPLATVVDDIAEEVASINIALFDTNDNQFVYDHPILDLIRNPGFNQSYEQFIKDYVIGYLLTRNSFLIQHGFTDKEPVSLAIAKPFEITARAGTDGYALQYHLSTTHKSARFDRQGVRDWRFIHSSDLLELNHLKGQTANDHLFGRSPLAAVMLDILQRIAGARHNVAMLQNGARLSGVLSFEESLSDDQLQRLKDQFNNTKTGFDNAGRILIAEGGKGMWNNLVQTNRDLDYKMLLRMAFESVALRYRYPLALQTVEALTFNNFASAVPALYDRAVLPTARIIYSGLEDAMFERFKIDGNRWKLTFDPKSIEALQDRFMERIKKKMEIGAHTVNELRADMGDEPVDGGDEILKPNTLIPMGVDIRTDDQPTPEAADAADDQKKAFLKHCGKSWDNNHGG